jgi:hypothetical protein
VSVELVDADAIDREPELRVALEHMAQDPLPVCVDRA